MAPTTKDSIDATSTAPAAVSFAIFAFSFLSGLIRSTKASILELISSKRRTIKITVERINHSVFVIFKVIPRIIEKKPRSSCILKFGSLSKVVLIP